MHACAAPVPAGTSLTLREADTDGTAEARHRQGAADVGSSTATGAVELQCLCFWRASLLVVSTSHTALGTGGGGTAQTQTQAQAQAQTRQAQQQTTTTLLLSLWLSAARGPVAERNGHLSAALLQGGV